MKQKTRRLIRRLKEISPSKHDFSSKQHRPLQARILKGKRSLAKRGIKSQFHNTLPRGVRSASQD